MRARGVVLGDEGEAYLDVQPDRRTWRQRVLGLAAEQAKAQGLSLDAWAQAAGTDVVHLSRLLAGRDPVTLDAVETLFAALGLRLGLPGVEQR